MTAASPLPRYGAIEQRARSRFCHRQLHHQMGHDRGTRDVADQLQQALVVEPIASFQGLVLDCLEGLPRPERWMTSVLNSPITLSARELSQESPALPTEGSMSASAGLSVERMLTYCDPRSL